MAETELRCLRCQGSMEQGFILDNSDGGRFVNRWFPGQPQKSFWHQTQAPADGHFPVGVFRCTRCGYLESYARPEFAAE